MKRAWACCALAVLGLFLTGCVSMILDFASGLSVHVGKPFIIVRTKNTKEWGHLTHPLLFPVSSNRIMLTYVVAGDPPDPKSRAAADWPAYSDDGGKMWKFGDPFTWENGKPDKPATEVKCGEPFPDGYMGFVYGSVTSTSGVRTANRNQIRIYAGGGEDTGIWSTNSGRTWLGPRAVTYSVPTNITALYLSEYGMEMPDGSFLCSGNGTVGVKWQTMMFRSVDGGKHYDYYSTIASWLDAPWGAEGANETTTKLLPDGEILCLIRTGCTYQNAMPYAGQDMLEARSQDGGKTWSHRRTSIRGIWPNFLRMSNGVLALSYGRPGVFLRFSRDNGKSWSSERLLLRTDVRTTGTVGMLEVAPGRLLVVYDTYNMPLQDFWLWEPPPSANAILGCFVDVSAR